MKTLLKQLLSIFYCPKWLATLICYWFGHKTTARYVVYEVPKKKWRGRDWQHKIGGTLEIITTYDPYFVHYCARCGKELGVKKLKRRLTEEEVLEYSKKIIDDIQLVKRLNK